MPALSAKTKRNLQRIIPHGIIWLFLGIVFFLVEAAITGGLPEATDSRIALTPEVLLFALIAITLVGLAIGAIELFFLNKRLAHKSFAKKILYKLLFYSALFFLITALTFPIAASIELKVSYFDALVWNKFGNYLYSWTNFSSLIQLGTALLVSLFYAEFSENIGHGILVNFLTGKYHRPIQEGRIFLFLDMKSSTSIAEKLGHEKYFKLLKDFYKDLSPAIIEHSGEIYQYVGDEVVISWSLHHGLLNRNCLGCFFAMQQDLLNKKALYEERYGVFPTFKGGMHMGTVTTGEIGALKKEIIFTGDVLNTTARIQALCNEYQETLIISEELWNKLQAAVSYQANPLGSIELKGKQHPVKLLAIQQK